MHVCNGRLGISFVGVEDVGCTAVGTGVFANGQIQIFNLAVFAKYLPKVIFVDILRQSLDNNLGAFEW